MVGQYGAGLHDAHEDVRRGGAGAEAGEVRALRAAVIAHAVALRAERGGEHLLAVCEVEGLLGLGVFPGLEGLGVRPETTRTGGGRDRRRRLTGGDGRDQLELGALGFRRGGERFLADVAHEALQRIAAFGLRQDVEVTEEILPELRGPADGGAAEIHGEADAGRSGRDGHRVGGGPGVTGVTREDLGVGDDRRAGLRDLHGLEHASRSRRLAEIDGELRELTVEHVVAGGQAGGGLLAETRRGGGVRLAMTREGDLEDALTVLQLTQILGLRDGVHGAHDRFQVFHLTATGERQGGVERQVMILSRPADMEEFAAPAFDGLVLDGDAGGVTDPAVGVTHQRPGFVEGGGGRGGVAESFKLATELLLRRGFEPAGRRGRCGALIGDAVERGLTAAAADGDVHVAVLRTDHDVGDGERLAGGEDFLAGLPAAAFRREVDGVERGVGPIARVEGALVRDGELRAGAHGGAGRAARADVDEGRLHVERREGVVTRAGAPAEFATRSAEVDAGRTIPRSAHVPLHVGVVGEDVAVRGDGAIIRIAEAGGHADPVLAVLVHARDPAADGLDAGGVAVGIFELLEEVVFVVTLRRRAGLLVVGQLGVVASDHEDRAVAVEDELVRAVLAGAFERADHRLLGVGAVALDVAQAPDVALALLAGAGVQGAVGEEEAVAAEELRVDLGDDGLAGVLQRDAPEHAALVAGDEVAFRRDRERDPGALLRLRDRVQELGLEAGLQDELVGRGDGSARGALAVGGFLGAAERIAPGSLAHLLHDRGRSPLGVIERDGVPALAGIGEGGLPIRAGFDEHGLAGGEAAGHRGDATVVAADDRERVHADLEVAGDFGGESVGPVIRTSELLAVEPDHAVVVGNSLELGDGRDFLQLEGGTEPDLLFRDVVLRTPDPERLGRCDGGNETKGEQAEQTSEHGVMRG